MQKEESTLEVKENFSSLQEEVDVKTKKLNKVALITLPHIQTNTHARTRTHTLNKRLGCQ